MRKVDFPIEKLHSSVSEMSEHNTKCLTKLEGKIIFVWHIIVSGLKDDFRTYCNYKSLTFRGKFGRVLKCRDWDTGDEFAAKFVLCTKREDRRNVEREIEIMNALKNPKLLRLFDAYDNGKNEMTLIME